MDWNKTVRDALNGNAKAWGLLFEQTQSMVYFTCVKLIHDAEAAQDIAQEVYIAAMKNLATLSDPMAFPAWIKRIAVNLSKNHLTRKRPMLFGEDEQEDMLGSIAEVREDFLPEEYAQKKETCRIITGMIDRLPDKQRMCVVLYYYDELSVSEIANIMQVSENTVKSRLNYARLTIKKEVEALEKKGTKLYCAGLPVLALILRSAAEDYSMSAVATAAVTAGFSAAAASAAETTAGVAAAGSAQSALSATAATTAATATTASAAAAASTGVFAKIAALPLIYKLIAGFLAVVMGVFGVVAGFIIGGNNGSGGKGNFTGTDFFWGIPSPDDPSRLDAEDLALKNAETRQQLEVYWTNNCRTEKSRFFFADITHDGIDELFSVQIEFPEGEYYVYSLIDGEVKAIFSDYSAEMTNWMYSHYLIPLEGKLYIIRSGFFGRQGYPLIMYEIFSLSSDGQRLMYKEESYENQEANDKEQEMQKTINQYEQTGVMVLGFESIDLSYGSWSQQDLDSIVEENIKK